MGSIAPTATAPTPTSGWASTSTATCSTRPTAPHCWARSASCPSTCDRRLPSRARPSTTATGRSPWVRRFRALKLWFTIRAGGATEAVEMIRRHVALTEQLVEWIGADDRFEIVAPHPLNLRVHRLDRRRRGHRSTHRASQRQRPRAVHAHRAGWSSRTALLDRWTHDRRAARARRMATAPRARALRHRLR